MGRRVLTSSGRRKQKNSGSKNKWQKIKEAKTKQHMRESTKVVLGNSEFLSKKQLKNLVKQPTNAIRPSGKRKRKILKRIGHQKRQDRKMDIEIVEDPANEGTPTKKAKKAKVQKMDIDEEDSSTVDSNEADMTS